MPPSLKAQIKSLQQPRLLTPGLEKFLRENDELVVRELVAQRMAKLISTPPRIRSGGFSPSQLGKCKRAQMFNYLGIPGVPNHDTTLQLVFFDGTWRHLRMQATFDAAGLLDDFEVPISIPKWRVSGSIDGVTGLQFLSKEADKKVIYKALLPFEDCYGHEYKGTRNLSFVMNSPMKDHVRQIHGYMIGSGLRKFSVFYEDKATQEYVEHVVTFDEDVAKTIRSEWSTLKKKVDEKKLLPILEECKNGKGRTFSWCSYREICLGCKDFEHAETLAQVVPHKPRVAKSATLKSGSKRNVRRITRKKKSTD